VTLRGKVLDIGGVKEKILAAYRAGLREVVLPAGNERDLRDVPNDVREGMDFHFVQHMEEVFKLALLEKREGRTKKRAVRASPASSRQRRKVNAQPKDEEGASKNEEARCN
jgi:ATP-dependent Lon protease